jgi:hypothetical protein
VSERGFIKLLRAVETERYLVIFGFRVLLFNLRLFFLLLKIKENIHMPFSRRKLDSVAQKVNYYLLVPISISPDGFEVIVWVPLKGKVYVSS